MSPHATSNELAHKRSSQPLIAKTKPLQGVHESSSIAEIRASLAALHTRDSVVTSQLRHLIDSQADLSRELGRLDLLRAHLGSQVIGTRNISHGMLDSAARTASGLSGRVKLLDLEKTRVEDTLGVVNQVAELKSCVQGVVGSMGTTRDWEAAAGYLHRASRISKSVTEGKFAESTVPTIEYPDSPAVTLENAKEILCGVFLTEFERAAQEGDGGRVTRYFKLFPLIGRGEKGLDVYGRYVCTGVSERARAALKEATGKQLERRGFEEKDAFAYAQALTKLFEHIAQIVEGHGGLVERHYGEGKMVKVVERLQAEADVQGGIVLDTWGEERSIERRLVDVKSYPFSFLVQSFMPQNRNSGINRTNSPAVGEGQPRMSEDEGVDMREIDGILNESAMMLGRWSLYCRFLAGKCKNATTPEDAPLLLPGFLTKSGLHDKIHDRLLTPFNIFTTFFFRRSVEKAFQLDEPPSGLSLNPAKTVPGNPPFIISAVDDIMYIVSTVLQRSISTSQRDVIASVVPTVGRVLGSDFVGMIQRKMRDESYPKPVIQGGLPPEDKIIAFIVLTNSLDVANEYISRIIANQLDKVPPPSPQTNGDVSVNGAKEAEPKNKLQNMFPFSHDAVFVENKLKSLETTFMAKTNELRNEALTVLFNNVVKPRLRPVLQDTWKDIDYSLSESELADVAALNELDPDEEAFRSLVPNRFSGAWTALMDPLQRIMTESSYTTLLASTVEYLGKMIEKKIWSYSGKVNGIGGLRMERDVSGIVALVCKGKAYGLREGFQRSGQICMVANMDEEEWEEIKEAGEEGMTWVLSGEEREKARQIVRN